MMAAFGLYIWFERSRRKVWQGFSIPPDVRLGFAWTLNQLLRQAEHLRDSLPTKSSLREEALYCISRLQMLRDDGKLLVSEEWFGNIGHGTKLRLCLAIQAKIEPIIEAVREYQAWQTKRKRGPRKSLECA